MSKFLFIRNDDVWTIGSSFRNFFNVMLQNNIPVIYGVVPGRLDETMADFLRKAKESQPELVDIVQHGFMHRNYAPAGERRYEFGSRRSYQEQLEDIHSGMRILHERFGDLLTPGFIPPYHAYDTHTIDAIEALEIPLFSARLKVPREKKKFLDVPANIWANRGDPDGGVSLPLGFHDLARDVTSIVNAGPISGVVFRHQMMTHLNDMDVLKAFVSLILQEQKKGKFRVVNFSNFLNSP